MICDEVLRQLSAKIEEMNGGRLAIIKKCKELDIWDGYDENRCTLTEISTHILDSLKLYLDGNGLSVYEVNIGSNYPELREPSYAGNCFRGWSESRAQGADILDTTGICPFVVDTTIYAQWREATLSDELMAYYPYYNDSYLDCSLCGNNPQTANKISYSDQSDGEYTIRGTVFDGKESYIKINSSPSLVMLRTHTTVMCWEYLNKWSGTNKEWNYLFAKEKDDKETGTRIWGLGFHKGTKEEDNYATMNDNAGDTQLTVQISEIPKTKKWQHVALVCSLNQDGESLTLSAFINGKCVGVNTAAGKQIEDNNQPLVIGRDRPGSTEYHDGLISDIRIYDRVLTESQIKEAMNYSIRTVETTSNPTEGGTITGAGNYGLNTTAVLKATPSENYQFKEWSNGEKDQEISIVIKDNVSLTAIFELIR